MRLIDADALKLKVYHEWIRDSKEIDRVVDSVPTIYAVEVVRCKDCKWSDWYETSSGEHRCYCTEHGSSGHTDDDYCSYGEREGE